MIETQLPGKLRKFFRNFKPRGRFDLDLRMIKSAGPADLTNFCGTVDADDASVEYHKFPYRVDHVSGTVALIDGGFVLSDITGRSGDAVIRLQGSVSEPSKYARVDIDIAGSDFISF